jgi:hypothetical protein
MKETLQTLLGYLTNEKSKNHKKTYPTTHYNPSALIHNGSRYAESLLILLPVLVFFIFVSRYAINVPYLDDMELVYTINDIKERPEDTLNILVRQQNDHRIFFSRLGMLLVYSFTGELNFRYATILGFFNLLLLAYAFYLIYKQYRQDLAGFSPIVILLFSPLVYFVHLSSLPAYQHSLSVAFSLLSLYFLQNAKQKQWYWALPFAFASTLTILDGLSTLPIGLAWLILQRRYRDGFFFGLASAVWLALYFSDFSFSSSSKLAFTPDSLLTMLYGFVAFVGASSRLISDTYSMHLSFVSGIVILTGFAFLLTSQMADKTYNFSLRRLSISKLELVDVCFLRILASGIMIAIGRAALGIEVVTAVRFQVFSLSILILFYLLLIRFLQPRYRRSFLALSVFLSVAGNLYAYAKYNHEAKELIEELKADTYNFTHHQLYLHQYYNLPDPPPDFYKNYSFPQFFSKTLVAAWHNRSTSSDKITLLSQEKENKGKYSEYIHHVVELEIQKVPQRVPHQDVYLTMQSIRDSSQKYMVSISESSNNFFKSLFLSNDNRTFYGLFLLKIPREKYQVRLCWVEGKVPRSILVSSNYKL